MTSFFVKYYCSSQYSYINEYNKNNGNIKTKLRANINRKRVSFTKHSTHLLFFFKREFQIMTFAFDDSFLSSDQDPKSLIQPLGSQIVAHTLTGTGNGPNRPDTINLWESGLKNWASSDFYNRYWGRGIWPRRLKNTNELGFFVRGVRFRWF